MARNTNPRKLVWVKVSEAFPNLKYGFRSGVEESFRGQLGQTVVAAADLQNLVVGANRPKPARASKKRATGYEGSFCSYDQIATLKQNGFSITPGKGPRLAKATTLSKPVYVTVNGIKYGWMSPVSTMPVTVGSIGVKDVGGTDTDILYGCEFPKPPRMKFINDTTGDSFSSFADPSNVDQAPAGWTLAHVGSYRAEDLARYL